MSALDEAREVGRARADQAGPITDQSVIARVAMLVHAALCNTSPLATNGRPSQATAVNNDPGDAAPDVHQQQ